MSTLEIDQRETVMTYIQLSEREKIAKVLECLPQQKPFRFVDDLDQINDQKVVGHYTFRQDESFYAGHFPGNPVTPGVILLECAAQIGMASLAIHLYLNSGRDPNDRVTFFSSATVDWLHPVRPGDKVIVEAEKHFWKMGRIVSNFQMFLENRTLVAKGTLTGVGVKK